MAVAVVACNTGCMLVGLPNSGLAVRSGLFLSLRVGVVVGGWDSGSGFRFGATACSAPQIDSCCGSIGKCVPTKMHG